MTAPSTLKPSALVAAAHIIASDGPGEVVRKLDAAFDAAVATHGDLDADMALTIDQRDTAEGWADGLAALIGKYFGRDIGEHSSAHCPWQEAKEIVAEAEPYHLAAVARPARRHVGYWLHHPEISPKGYLLQSVAGLTKDAQALGWDYEMVFTDAPALAVQTTPQQAFRPGKPGADVDVAWLMVRSLTGDGEGGSDESDTVVLALRGDDADWLVAGDWRANSTLDSVFEDGGQIVGWMPYEVPAARFAAAPQAPAATVDIHHLVQSCEAVIAEWSRQKSLFPILSRDGWMDDRVAELRTAIQAAPSTLPGVVFDMVALVKQLVLEHRIAEPNSLLAATALEYLKGHGLLASPLQIHSDDAALDRFTLAMRAKLAAARAKGRSGWESCPPEALNRMLHEHIEKGDPRDVANFCMFLWHTGHRTTMPAPAAPSPLSVRQVHPLGTAPKDGTIVQLLVQFVAHPPGQETVLNGAGPLYDTADACWTIGGNSVENTGIDHWQFVGWNWEQDYFVDTSTDAGHRVLGWAPFDVAAPAVDAPVLPAIKGAWIDGGYVIVTPAGTGQANAVKAAILAALPVAPDAASAKNKGVE